MPPKSAKSTASSKKEEVVAPPPELLAPVDLGPEIDDRKEAIRQAFAIYDPDNTKTVPEEEVPTIMRYLGLFVPDKDFVEKILVELHGDEPSPFIRLEKFEKICISLMDAQQYAPDQEDVLLAAFQALDTEHQGWVSVAKLKELMCSMGEPPFTDREAEAFIKVAADKAEPDRVYYEDYVAMMSRGT